MILYRLPELDIHRLLENELDLQLAIDTCEDWDELGKLYHQRDQTQREIETWLLTCEVSGHA